MKRTLALSVCGWLCVLMAGAQNLQVQPAQPGPRQAPPRPQGPQGETKLRWVCKQLKLDPQQQQQAEALISVYNAKVEAEKQNPLELMERVKNKLAEVEAAKQSGDTARATALQAEVRDLAPGVKAEKEFYASLEQVLKPEQKEQLPRVSKLADSVGDISIRPVHVLRAARAQTLTADQEKQLEKSLTDFRTKMQSAPRTPDQAANEALLNTFIDEVRKILTPDQAKEFDAEIADLRTGAPPAAKPILPGGTELVVPTREPSPATQPAAPAPATPPGAPQPKKP